MSDPCSLGPVPNPDIVGIGTRVAAYVQALVLTFIVREGKVQDRTDAAWTLVLYNLLFATATLYFGFRTEPLVTLYDALYCGYNLVISSFPLAITFISSPKADQLIIGTSLQLAIVAQTILVAGTILSVLVHVAEFGSDASCNNRRVLVLFFIDMDAQGTGRDLCVIIVLFMLAVFLWLSFRSKPWEPMMPSLWSTFVIVTVYGVVSISHAELFLGHNHPQPGERSWASFGQIISLGSCIYLMFKAGGILLNYLPRDTVILPLHVPSIFRHSPGDTTSTAEYATRLPRQLSRGVSGGVTRMEQDVSSPTEHSGVEDAKVLRNGIRRRRAASYTTPHAVSSLSASRDTAGAASSSTARTVHLPLWY